MAEFIAFIDGVRRRTTSCTGKGHSNWTFSPCRTPLGGHKGAPGGVSAKLKAPRHNVRRSGCNLTFTRATYQTFFLVLPTIGTRGLYILRRPALHTHVRPKKAWAPAWHPARSPFCNFVMVHLCHHNHPPIRPTRLSHAAPTCAVQPSSALLAMASARALDDVVLTGFDHAAQRIENEMMALNPVLLSSSRLDDRSVVRVASSTARSSIASGPLQTGATVSANALSPVPPRSATSTSPVTPLPGSSAISQGPGIESGRSNERHIKTIKSNFNRVINSRFEKGLGRQATPKEAPSSSDRGSNSSSRRSNRKLKRGVRDPSPIRPLSPISGMQCRFADESIAPPHKPIRHSSVAPFHK